MMQHVVECEEWTVLSGQKIIFFISYWNIQDKRTGIIIFCNSVL